MIRRKANNILRLLSLGAVAVLSGCSSNMVLLDPKGPVGAHEKTLILASIAIMMVVAIPVFVMTFYFAWKYRASNKNATYAPKWSHSNKIEFVVWTVPTVIVAVLGYLVWTDTHDLSPYKPLVSAHKPINVEAIAMDWKWLFIYPDQHIATVNQLEFPANVPVNFRITSDTVMTSFFIPRLGSQIYAMAGMQTRDSLLATEPGTYVGRNCQFSGRGFSNMQFNAIATSPQQFKNWVEKIKQSGSNLGMAKLKELEKPSRVNPVTYYSSVRPHLFDYIIHKYVGGGTATMTANAAQKKPHA
ncbi:MAG: ubiquinol oxidase subunit II [Gammaproteobacteria bacterium]|jgi:cytochrome o ubiquinol oxidase subunit II